MADCCGGIDTAIAGLSSALGAIESRLTAIETALGNLEIDLTPVLTAVGQVKSETALIYTDTQWLRNNPVEVDFEPVLNSISDVEFGLGAKQDETNANIGGLLDDILALAGNVAAIAGLLMQLAGPDLDRFNSLEEAIIQGVRYLYRDWETGDR